MKILNVLLTAHDFTVTALPTERVDWKIQTAGHSGTSMVFNSGAKIWIDFYINHRNGFDWKIVTPIYLIKSLKMKFFWKCLFHKKSYSYFLFQSKSKGP